MSEKLVLVNDGIMSRLTRIDRKLTKVQSRVRKLVKQRDALLEACEGLLSNGAWPVGESDRDRYYEFCEKANAAIAMARKGEK